MDEPVNRNLVLAIAAVASFVGALNLTAVNVAIPSIGNEFGMNAATMGWVSNTFGLVQAAIIIPIGRLADLYGRLKVLKIGMLISAVAFFLCTIAPTGSMFLALRGLQGFGAAMTMGTGLAIVTLVFPLHERGRAIGDVMTAVYIGVAAGPSMGGVLTSQFGWRSIFWSFAVISLSLAFVLYWKIKRDWAEARGQHFDWPGAVLLVIATALVMYGFSELPSSRAIGLIVAGLAGLMGFVGWTKRTASPILNVNLMKSNKTLIFRCWPVLQIFF
jgi:MFS family permease